MESIEVTRDEQSVPAELLWTMDSTRQSRWNSILPLLSLALIPAAWYAVMVLFVDELIFAFE